LALNHGKHHDIDSDDTADADIAVEVLYYDRNEYKALSATKKNGLRLKRQERSIREKITKTNVNQIYLNSTSKHSNVWLVERKKLQQMITIKKFQ
jgi:hypothetical protein